MIFRDSVVRLRAAQVTGGYGNQTRDWDNATEATYPAVIGPVSTDENITGQDRTTSRWRLFLPPNVDVVATDRIRWDGDTYEVDGDVQPWKRGRRLHHFEALLIKITQR